MSEQFPSGPALDAGEDRWLVELEGGARIGAIVGPDGAVSTRTTAWVLYEPRAERRIGVLDEASLAWLEVLQAPRTDFEDQLQAGAAEAGLSADEVLRAFPALSLLRVALTRNDPYAGRLALEWMLPSERPELRKEIGDLSKHAGMPVAVRALAQRMSKTR